LRDEGGLICNAARDRDRVTGLRSAEELAVRLNMTVEVNGKENLPSVVADAQRPA
jgi:hypothetical protein